MATAYVVTIGDRPLAVAPNLFDAQSHAEKRATEHSSPELQWKVQRPDEWRMMFRHAGNKRFSWSGYAVHAAPEVA